MSFATAHNFFPLFYAHPPTKKKKKYLLYNLISSVRILYGLILVYHSYFGSLYSTELLNDFSKK